MSVATRDTEQRDFSVFIAYRQGDDEHPGGKPCARWLHENLQGRTLAIDGQPADINTYWDQTAPAVGDWRDVWEGDLLTARAFILVCSDGTANRHPDQDWLYEEIEWWLNNREVAPIVVNAGDPGSAPIPPPVKERWSYIQWVNWSSDPLEREQTLRRILEGITLAETGVRYQELERTRRLLHETEAARLDALAALNKAEALRLEAASETDAELTVLAQKYRAQIDSLADRAEALRAAGLQAPERTRIGAADKRPFFALEALDVEHGSCLLVHYGRGTQRRFILIDGGPRAAYGRRLRPRLQELQVEWGGGGPLELEAIISTQADEGESGGIQRLLEDLLAGKGVALRVRRFWTNSFDPFNTYVPDRKPVLSALILPQYARRLGFPVNQPFDFFVSQPKVGAPQIEFADGMTVTVLGPRGAFSGFWVREVERAIAKQDPSGDLVRTPAPAVVETVSSPEIYLRPSPLRLPEIHPGRDRDMSDRNRTSIVLLLEFAGRRMLLTSDSRGDDVVPATAQAGLLNRRGSALLDLLSVPHYGSKRNVNPGFFASLNAESYLVQCNERFLLPDPETLQMLVESRALKPFTLYFTQQGHRPEFRRRCEDAIARAGVSSQVRTVWREPSAASLMIDLIQ